VHHPVRIVMDGVEAPLSDADKVAIEEAFVSAVATAAAATTTAATLGKGNTGWGPGG
jgi:hypothetical protein